MNKSVFDYIETFYDRKRTQSYLNYVSLEDFEKGRATVWQLGLIHCPPVRGKVTIWCVNTF